MVSLLAMSDDESIEWLEQSRHEFAAEHARVTGSTPDASAEHARLVVERTLPDGHRSDGHSFRWIVDDGRRVGHLWLGPAPDGSADAYIWDMEIGAKHRGKGYGTEALELVVGECRRAGVPRIRLSVFATNDAARRLYERMGFIVDTECGHQIEMTLHLEV